jgi:aerobic carbon-monoxide dehydrogenase small subunit
MKTRNERKKGSSLAQLERADSKLAVKPAAVTRGVISEAAKTKVSRRTLLKGTAAAAAVVGVSAVTMKVAQAGPREQASSSAESLPPVPVVPTTPADLFAAQTITLSVNGKNYTASVEPRDMLVNVLREQLNLIGTKRPCNRMECGGCTVLINGTIFNSCNYLATRAVGKQILTIEGTDPVLQALQAAWITNDASQCGYCQPGMLMAATALLKSNPNPTTDEIKSGLRGNICRCGAYLNVIEAVQAAATGLGGA